MLKMLLNMYEANEREKECNKLLLKKIYMRKKIKKKKNKTHTYRTH